MRKVFRLAFILLVLTFICPQINAQGIEVPYYDTAQTITNHYGYTLLYNESHEQADWVAYELTASETDGMIDRTDDFRVDPAITTGSAELSDYKYSGYDRGHLIPAGDARWSEHAMTATFVLSNMSPQEPSFNRGDWRKLESYVRTWAKENGALHVVTGPALKQGVKNRIGSNQVSVPRYYYKVVLDYEGAQKKGIGFIMPNGKLNRSVEAYSVSIDSVEAFTGIDFYYQLPDSVEEQIESNYNLSHWSFDNSSSTNKRNQSQSSATRCKGITQDGDRCKRRTTNESGYCWQHEHN